MNLEKFNDLKNMEFEKLHDFKEMFMDFYEFEKVHDLKNDGFKLVEKIRQK